MSLSSKNPTVTDRGSNKREEDGDKEGGGRGFIDKVDFIHDISEKIEEVVGFGKPNADVSGIHIPHVNLNPTDLVVDMLIKNPNPVPIPLVDIDVTTPPEIILYYRLNHSIWSLSDNKEVSR
jgi:hypothetical protein